MTRSASSTPSRPVGPAVFSAARGAGGQGAFMHAPSNRRPYSARLEQWLRDNRFDVRDDAVNCARDNAMTPLMHAARLGDLEIARELLALGAELNARNIDGNNALWLACYGGNLDLIDLLLAAGIDADNVNDNGATCLMYAASAGKAATVARLLAAGANIELATVDGFTAGDVAATIECLQLLRKAKRERTAMAATA